eukprot:g18432.t1
MIWMTENLDAICWGEKKDVIKGFFRTTELREVNQGLGKQKNRLYLVSATRTLELEASDTSLAEEWRR